MIVADSDVLVDHLRNRGPEDGPLQRALRDGRLATTTISLFELESGARKERELRAVRRLLAPLALLGLGVPEAREAAEVRRRLLARGRRIGEQDSLIAGICLHHDYPLLTRNIGRFDRVEDLRLVED